MLALENLLRSALSCVRCADGLARTCRTDLGAELIWLAGTVHALPMSFRTEELATQECATLGQR